MLIECHNEKCPNHFRDHTCMVAQLPESGCNERMDASGFTPDWKSVYSLQPRVNYESEEKNLLEKSSVNFK